MNLKKLGNLVYLIKLFRLPRGLTLLNVKYFIRAARDMMSEKKPKTNLEDDDQANATGGHNMGAIMFVSFILRTVRMIIDIISISYFVGMSWLIMCKTIQRVELEAGVDVAADDARDTFL